MNSIKREKVRKKTRPSESLSLVEGELTLLQQPIEDQCSILGIPFEQMMAKSKLRPDYRFNWYCEFNKQWVYPEKYVLNKYINDGWRGANVEGRFIHTILKLLAESKLSGYWTLDYFCVSNLHMCSGQNLVHHQNRIKNAYDCLCQSTEQDLIERFKFSTNSTPIYDEFNRLQPIFKHAMNWPVDFLVAAFRAIGKNNLTKMMEIMMIEGEKLKYGWPDVTVIKNDEIKFIEVKTTDKFNENQIRVWDKIIKPLNLDFKVIQLIPETLKHQVEDNKVIDLGTKQC